MNVELPVHAVLYECGGNPRYAYFLTSGLASVVIPISNGEVVEVGFIGHEGIVGSLQLLGSGSTSSRCMMQLAGSGLKIPFVNLQWEFDRSQETRKRVPKFVQEQAAMVAQIAGCNRLHTAEQRLSWPRIERTGTYSISPRILGSDDWNSANYRYHSCG